MFLRTDFTPSAFKNNHNENCIYGLKGSRMSGISTYLKILHCLYEKILPDYYREKKEGDIEVLFIDNNSVKKLEGIKNKKVDKLLCFMDGKTLSKINQRFLLSYLKQNNLHTIFIIGCDEDFRKGRDINFNCSNLIKEEFPINPDVKQTLSKDFLKFYYEFNLSFPTKILGKLSKKAQYFKDEEKKSPQEIYGKIYEKAGEIGLDSLKIYKSPPFKIQKKLLKNLIFNDPFQFNKNMIDKEIKKLYLKNIKSESIINQGKEFDLIKEDKEGYKYTIKEITTVLFGRKPRTDKVRNLKGFNSKEGKILRQAPESFIKYHMAIKRETRKIEEKNQKFQKSLKRFLINNKIALLPSFVDKLIKEDVFLKTIGKTIKLREPSEWGQLDFNALIIYDQIEKLIDAFSKIKLNS